MLSVGGAEGQAASARAIPRFIPVRHYSPMARTIRCVTFDCYGTLIDWQGGISRALLAVPALSGRPDLVRKLVARREEIEKGMIVSAPELPQDDSPEERYESPPYRPYREILAESIDAAARELDIPMAGCDPAAVAATMPDWEPFPDTRAALVDIKKRFPIAILSNVEDEVIAESARKLGVPFDLIITAEEVGAYKPSPDHWYAAMHELEADEEDLFHLAASPFHDLETATLLGIRCGYVNRSGHPLLPEAKPLFTVQDMAGAAERMRSYAASTRRTGRPIDSAEA